MTKELLEFYAGCYTDDARDPLCSPLFGDLEGLPPSLLFVGGDEVMLDDTRRLHEKLLASGCKSRMLIAPERWHAYVLYNLSENMEQDFSEINRFLTKVLSPAKSLRWMRLDNAAKIYPAAKRRNWTNFFRLSATLTEPVDTDSAARGAGRDGAALPVDRRAAAAGRVLVLSRTDPAWHRRSSRRRAARWHTHAVSISVRRCALRVLCVSQPDRRGVFPRADGRARAG